MYSIHYVTFLLKKILTSFNKNISNNNNQLNTLMFELIALIKSNSLRLTLPIYHTTHTYEHIYRNFTSRAQMYCC